MTRLPAILVAVLSIAAIGVATARLLAADAGVAVERVMIGDTPALVFRPAPERRVAEEPPVVVVAHGFAGSKTLMRPFSTALAKNGYVAVAFDFFGHGEHSAPLAGDVTDIDGPTRALVAQTEEVAQFAQSLPGTGNRLAVAGHSMASDIVVRFAQGREDVEATIAISMFSPAVTAQSPRNLLVIVGEWEAGLADEAIRAVGLAAGGEAEEGVTYGDPAAGTGRRAVFADAAEHIAVLYDVETFAETVAWLDATFGIAREGPVETSARLPWIGLLVLGVLALAWPLSKLLPVVSRPFAGAGLGWRPLWPVIVVPAVATPIVLTFVPTNFLPVVLGDYLAVHFLVYGALTAALLWWRGRRRGRLPAAGGPPRQGAMAIATVAVTLYALGGLGLVIDWQVTNYLPVPARLPLLGALAAGTLPYFLATEWATRGEGAARGAFVAAKAAFLVSIGIAVALDFERLFFLIIIVPIIVLFFVIYGLYSRWSYRRTGHPLPAAVANAIAFAWAITHTFPMLAG